MICGIYEGFGSVSNGIRRYLQYWVGKYKLCCSSRIFESSYKGKQGAFGYASPGAIWDLTRAET